MTHVVHDNITRGGKLLLGVFFWLQIARLLMELSVLSFTLAQGGFSSWNLLDNSDLPVSPMTYATMAIVDGLSWFATAAIGWFYVFRHRYKVVWLLIALWGTPQIVFGLVEIGGAGGSKLPTDALLEETFRLNEDDFNKLAKMANEDEHVQTIGFDVTHLKSNVRGEDKSQQDLSKERWDEYRRLFKKLGLMFLDRTQGLGIEFILAVAAEKEIGRHIGKGYAYSVQEPSPIVDSLDGISPEDQKPVFKKIKDNWYLYYVCVD